MAEFVKVKARKLKQNRLGVDLKNLEAYRGAAPCLHFVE